MLWFVVPLLLVPLVAGHGHVTNIVINGLSYAGWDIDSYPYETDPPIVVAWGTPNTGNGFITPDQYNSSDIICHENATNARGHAPVAAGDKVNVQWTSWPSSHHGPVITYLANCGDSCETVDKTTLEFFKISGVGLIDDSDVPGTWGDDQLIANNNSWLVEIPLTLAPGYYVLRNEIIALHSAGEEDGAQNYPQCFNLQVTGSGTASPSGVLGTELYSPTGAGIVVNIYASLSTYQVPGPTLYSGAVSITQSSSSATASGTPVTGSGAATAAASSGSETTSSETTSSETSTLLPTSTASTATFIANTPATSQTATRVIATSTLMTVASRGSRTSVDASSTQSVYGQCGGTNWTGATACNTLAACSSMNPFYYQCVPTAV
ncbi:uncharacterized protein N7459_003801 [Penicillium hispanicum]|uniref:uncharacterized protein n=1 Tax=Penicillium hispanicum TaxID=1080232 RepID=UPI002540E094|nr:uncharacterized protein N7459_003801 [Penicillium hispanicum]KAJ5584001.1 hypothetical protein N7459_003801 [Penicillium hispanicum]